MVLTFRIRAHTLVLIAIVAMAAGLRLAYFNGLHLADDPDYAARAHALWSGNGSLYGDNNGFRIGTWMPVVFGYALFGVTHAGLVVYPLLMSLLAVVLVHALGRLLFGAPAGLIAAGLYACYPLDVELASRLLPDPLLASFSLLAAYLLISADVTNTAGADSRLQRQWRYAAAGAVLAWCTAVNMSAVAFGLFIAVYYAASLAYVVKRRAGAARREAWGTFGVRRALWLGSGFLAVAALEALAYYQAFGNPFLKYSGTIAHYTTEGRSFFRDLWHYPRHMFFVGSDWRVHVLDAGGRAYGYYFVLALPALVLGLWRGGARFAAVAGWLIIVWCFLQWGTMSFSHWEFLHRLDRHLNILTPALVLVLAGGIAQLRSVFARWMAAPALIAGLVLSSWTTIQARHRQLDNDVATMEPIHRVLELVRPKSVYTDTQTIAYQRFLDGYRDEGRRYEPIEVAASYTTDRTIAIIQTVSALSVLPSGDDAAHPPPHWIPLLSLPGEAPGARPGQLVRLYWIRPRATDDAVMPRIREPVRPR